MYIEDLDIATRRAHNLDSLEIALLPTFIGLVTGEYTPVIVQMERI